MSQVGNHADRFQLIDRRCGTCNAPRQGASCWKCGAETFTPAAEWEEPALPPIDKIRELAREVGYGLAVHGSLERDLDLIAAPWTDEAVGNYDLIQHIAKGLGGRVVEYEPKPMGRQACSIQMDGWYKPIDLSVCPRKPPEPLHVGHRYREVSLRTGSFTDSNLAAVSFGLEINKDDSFTNAVYLLVRPKDMRCDEAGEHPPSETFAQVIITYEELRAMVKALDDDWALQQKHAPMPEGPPTFAGETKP